MLRVPSRQRRRVLTALLIQLAAAPTAALAQRWPVFDKELTRESAVSVSPRHEHRSIAPGSKGLLLSFTFRNNGDNPVALALTCSATGELICTRPSPGRADLEGGGSQTTFVRVSMPPESSGGTIRVSALSGDSVVAEGTYDISPGDPGPSVDAVRVDPPTEVPVETVGREAALRFQAVNLGMSDQRISVRCAVHPEVQGGCSTAPELTLSTGERRPVVVRFTPPEPSEYTITVVASGSFQADSSSVVVKAHEPADTTDTPLLSVTPLSGRASKVVQSPGSAVDTFDIRYDGPTDTISFSVRCVGIALHCVGPEPVVLGPGASYAQTARVSVGYDLAEGDGTGGVTLVATAAHAPTITAEATIRLHPPITLSLSTADPSIEQARVDCPRAQAGAGAIECDDYRYRYSLPTLRRLGSEHRLDLTYLSSTVGGSQVVAADLSIPDGAKVDRVMATLAIDGVVWDSTSYTQVAAGTSNRIAFLVPPDVSSRNALVAYSITAVVEYSNNRADTLRAQGRFVSLNRAREESEFGSGWWLSGYERLQPVSDSDLGDVLIWSGGDGSSRAYLPLEGRAGAWVASTRAVPDTIYAAVGPSPDAAWYLDLDKYEYASTGYRSANGLDGATKMTWAFWINATHSSGRFAGLRNQLWESEVWWFDITNDGLQVGIQGTSEFSISSASAPLPWNQWAFVVVEYDGEGKTNSDRLRIWIDDQEQEASYRGAIPSSLAEAPDAALGMGRANTNFGLEGKLGEFAILKNLLSAPERTGWRTLGIDFSDPDLVAGYEWAGSLEDASPSGNDLESPNLSSSDNDFMSANSLPSRGTPQGGWHNSIARSAYLRQVLGGGQVRYDAAGRVVGRIDRNGNETRYEYALFGAETRLTGISLPSMKGTEPAYRIDYDPVSLAPTEMRVAAGDDDHPWVRFTLSHTVHDGDPTLSKIEAPDGSRTEFSYSDDLLVAVTDPRNATTRIHYQSGKVDTVQVILPGSGDLPTAMSSVRPTSLQAALPTTTFSYRPASLLGTEGSGPFGPLDSDSVSSILDGPRQDVDDVTRYFVTAWGDLRGIRDALGQETWFERGDPMHSSFVTRTSLPNGRVVLDTFDPANGLRTRSLDRAEDDATLEVEWDSRWRRPIRIRSAEGIETTFTLDSAGNVTSEGIGTDRTRFERETHGLVTASTSPEGHRQLFEYDALGNLTREVSALGFETTFARDPAGRIVERRTETKASGRKGVAIESFGFDSMGRPIVHRRWNTVDDASMQDSTVFDTHGDPSTVYQTATEAASAVEGVYGGLHPSMPALPEKPPILRTFDALGRVTTVSHDGGMTKSVYHYDLSGNLDRVITAAGDSIYLTYDALNRLVERRSSDRRYSADSKVAGSPDDDGFRAAMGGSTDSAFKVPGDDATFTYGPMGNLRTAANSSAIISRDYTLRGQLRVDSLSVLGRPSGENVAYAAAVAFEYDRDGRLTTVRYPTENASPHLSASYFYDKTRGRQNLVLDALGYQTTLGHDGDGKITRVVHPGDLVETLAYDADGRLVRRDVGPYISDALEYDPAGRLLTATGRGGGVDPSVEYAYDGLGHLTEMTGFSQYTSGPTQLFAFDGRGELILRQSTRADGSGAMVESRTYDPATGRYTGSTSETLIAASQRGGYVRYNEVRYEPTGAVSTVGSRLFQRDADGSIHAFLWTTGSAAHNYYDAEGHLRYRQRLDAYRTLNPLAISHTRGAWEEYRYDALGRRVEVQMISEGYCTPSGPACVNADRFFAWGGDRIFSEASLPVAGYPETPKQYGRVYYTHPADGDGLISVIQEDAKGNRRAFFPHLGARGLYVMATDSMAYPCEGGRRACAGLILPGNQADALGAVDLDAPVSAWFGSLLNNQRSLTGLLYRYDGYFDPELSEHVGQAFGRPSPPSLGPAFDPATERWRFGAAISRSGSRLWTYPLSRERK